MGGFAVAVGLLLSSWQDIVLDAIPRNDCVADYPVFNDTFLE